MILYDAEGNEVEVEDPQAAETPNVKQMREALERAKADAKEGAAAKRELALFKSGVDTSTTLGKMFAATLDDVSDPVATKAAYEALVEEVTGKKPGSTEATPGEVATPVESTGSAERNDLANDADTGDINSGVDPRQAAMDGAKAIAESPRGKEEDALASFVGAIADGTAKGTIPQAGQRDR